MDNIESIKIKFGVINMSFEERLNAVRQQKEAQQARAESEREMKQLQEEEAKQRQTELLKQRAPKIHPVIAKAKTRMQEDLRYKAISGFLTGAELNDAYRIIASQSWYKPRTITSAMRDHCKREEKIETVVKRCNPEIRFASLEDNIDFWTCEVVEEYRLGSGKYGIYEPAHVKFEFFSPYSDTVLDSENDIDKMILSSLIMGGSITMTGGTRVLPEHYEWESQEITDEPTNTRPYLSKVKQEEKPIQISCFARWNPFQGKVIYGLGTTIYSESSHLLDRLALDILNEKDLENIPVVVTKIPRAGKYRWEEGNLVHYW
jgi:hypothetical protein